MASFRQILVPTDFSPTANRAFAFALRLARAGGATIHLFHDVEVPVETITAATIVREQLDRARAEGTRQMETLIAAHDAADVVAERVIERSTEPVRSIPYYAETHGLDLIVMGTHGRTSVREKLIGSRAERVLREAPCPVVTVPVPAERVRHTAITHVVVPVDFSEYAVEALRMAREIATLFGARLSLLHAEGGKDEAAVRRDVEHWYVHVARGEAPVDVLVSAEAPADAILSVADEARADLIVMTTHAREGLERLFQGDVADHVVAHAPCPVLVLPTEVMAGGAG